MEKVYMHYPYLEHLNTKIKRKFTKDNETHIVFYHTIFAPKIDSLIPDKGTVNDIPIQRAYEENGEIIHVFNQDIHEGQITMNIDLKHRLEGMKLHIAYLILKNLAETIYGVQTSQLHYLETENYFDLSPAYYLPEKFEQNLEKLCGEIIQNALPITSLQDDNQSIMEIPGLGTMPCDGLHLDNTGEVFAVHIDKTKKIGSLLRLYFIAGERCYQEYQKLYKSILPIAQERSLSINETLLKLTQYKKENDQLREKVASYDQKILLKDVALLEKERHYLRGIGIICHVFEEDTNLYPLGEALTGDIILLGDSSGKIYLRVTDKKYNLSPLIDRYAKQYELQGTRTALKYKGKVGNKHVEDFLHVLLDQITKRIR